MFFFHHTSRSSKLNSFLVLKSSKINAIKKLNLKQKINSQNFIQSYQNFKMHLISYKKLINKYILLKKKLYVIGAGLMLPIVNYHLDGLLNKAEAILDDDKNKQNKYFLSINTKISSLKKTNLKRSVCLISTISSAIVTRQLTDILKKKRAEIILVPH